MNELVIIVEGETEQTFVRDELAAHLALKNTTVWPVLPGKHRNHGGIKTWEVARRDIIYTLRELRYCSTMFDYYAMPEDWPGRAESRSKSWNDRAGHIEAAMHADILAAMGDSFDGKYFIPYVQLHEFEALAFADIHALAAVLAPIGKDSPEKLTKKLQEILDVAGEPEAIDDGYETCPSRRIAKIVPAYKKRAQGPIITRRIGINVLRSKCLHFNHWLTRLEAINASEE